MKSCEVGKCKINYFGVIKMGRVARKELIDSEFLRGIAAREALLAHFKIKRWLTNSEAASYLEVSANFLNQDRLSGLNNIPFLKIGRLVRYDQIDLERWLESRKVKTR